MAFNPLKVFKLNYLIGETNIKPLRPPKSGYTQPSAKKVYVFNESGEIIKEYSSIGNFVKVYKGVISSYRLSNLIKNEESFNGEYFSYNPYLKGYGSIL